ncbi:hypothetical protein [Stenotrophomonas sp. TWI819]|uniref:hypothetical protein n=1 Tax=Stenotrophomonas sp. TWI819 TaxID=3136800 RepID=UPI003208804C
MTDVAYNFQKTLKEFVEHELLSDDDLICLMAQHRKVLLARVESLAKGSFFEGAQKRSMRLFELGQARNALRIHDEAPDAIAAGNYGHYAVKAFAEGCLSPTHARASYALAIRPLADYELHNYTKEMSDHPDMLAGWRKWLASDKPIRGVDVNLLTSVIVDKKAYFRMLGASRTEMESRRRLLDQLNVPPPPPPPLPSGPD